jgi:hypothetical protein
VHVDRHKKSRCRMSLICGSLNIRSLTNKLDDFLDVRRAQQIAVTFLTEAWHDGDSVCLCRLRAAGFQVIDRPRPRLRTDTLTKNHGGIVVVAIPGVSLSAVSASNRRIKLTRSLG